MNQDAAPFLVLSVCVAAVYVGVFFIVGRAAARYPRPGSPALARTAMVLAVALVWACLGASLMVLGARQWAGGMPDRSASSPDKGFFLRERSQMTPTDPATYQRLVRIEDAQQRAWWLLAAGLAVGATAVRVWGRTAEKPAEHDDETG